MFDRQQKQYPPTLNQQTGQWHFYDDDGKPVELKKPEPDSDDEAQACCIRIKR